MRTIQEAMSKLLKMCTGEVDSKNNILYAYSAYVNALVVGPHDDIDTWLVRIAPKVSFDRWANSGCIEKRFALKQEVVDYLKNSKLDIYQELFEIVSGEYVDAFYEKDDSIRLYN